MDEGRRTFSKCQLNFFRVCYLTTDVLPQILRSIFVTEWDQNHGARYGPWENTSKNGQDFVSLESKQAKKRHPDTLSVLILGDCLSWDCTKLFYALLYSNTLGPHLKQSTRQHLDDLRRFRNESFAHVKGGEISSCDFQKLINRLLQAFLCLGQDPAAVKDAQTREFATTERVDALLSRVEQDRSSQLEFDQRLSDLEERVSTLEAQVGQQRPRETNSGQFLTPTPICLLPAPPDHAILTRDVVKRAVNTISCLRKIQDGYITAVYMTGAVGCGLTECARQIATAASGCVNHIMTLDASSVENFVDSLKIAASGLGFDDQHSVRFINETSLQAQCELLSLYIRDTLSGTSAWLAIVDDLREETRSLCGYLPGEIGHEGRGQFLVTTHDRATVVESSCTTTIHVSGLTTNESIEMCKTLAGPISLETVEILSDAIGNQPDYLASALLAIRQISSDEHQSLEVFCKKRIDYLKSRYKEKMAYHLAAVSQATRSKLESLVQLFLERSDVYRELFHLLLLTKGESIPFDFVVNFISYHLGMQRQATEDILGNTYLLVRTSDKNSTGYVCVNKVMYKVVSDVLGNSVRDEATITRLKSLGQFAMMNMHDSVVCASFKLFTPEILRYLAVMDMTFPQSLEQRRLHHELGKTFLCVLVDYSSALRCFTKALLIFEKANDVKQREYACVLTSIGNVFRLTGNTEEAKEYLEKSLKLLKSLAISHLDDDIANCLSSLGLVSQSQQDLQRAKQLHTQALVIRQQLYGGTDIHTATSLNNIGGVYHESGDLATAKDYYWRALEIKGRYYGWDVPHVANSFNNIAEISHEQGDLCGAIPIHKRSLKIRQRLYGEIHPDVANSLNNIAVIYHKLGELPAARKYHTKVVQIRTRIYGEFHLDVACSLSNLGRVFYDEGDLAAAEKCHTDALAIRQRHSTRSPCVVDSLYNLMKVYLADREFASAKEYAYQLFTIFQQNYGINDAKTVKAFRRITNISKRQSDGCDGIPLDTFEEVERLSCL